MNSRNSETYDPHRLLLKLLDKIKLKRSNKYVALSNLSIYYKWKNIRIYLNKIENRIAYKIKTGYYLELLSPETMKLLGRNKSKITKDKNGENVPNSEITEIVLAHCNIVNNNY